MRLFVWRLKSLFCRHATPLRSFYCWYHKSAIFGACFSFSFLVI
nr:MAG TPA: hypothetical protein [Caudoviricetes sp.]